jgi:Protein of unknown function (DUF2786)
MTANMTAAKLAKKRQTIELLLAKAESTNHVAEAELAMAQAEKMMIQYGFDRATLNGDNRQSKVMVREYYQCKGTYHLGKARAYAAVANAYKSVDILQINARGNSITTLIFIGEQGDVADLVRVMNSLDIQAEHAVKSWWATRPAATAFGRQEAWKARRDFVVGFGLGAAQRVRESLAEEVVATAGNEIVLANRMSDAVAHRESLYPSVRANKSRMHGGLGGLHAGREAGLKANIGGKAVDGPSTKALS